MTSRHRKQHQSSRNDYPRSDRDRNFSTARYANTDREYDQSYYDEDFGPRYEDDLRANDRYGSGRGHGYPAEERDRWHSQGRYGGSESSRGYDDRDRERSFWRDDSSHVGGPRRRPSFAERWTLPWRDIPREDPRQSRDLGSEYWRDQRHFRPRDQQPGYGMQGYEGSNRWEDDSDFGHYDQGSWGQSGPYAPRSSNLSGNWNRNNEPSWESRRQNARGPKGYSRSDERIREDVCDRMLNLGIDAGDVEVQVSSGEVTLTGTVRERSSKRTLENVTEGVSGVKEVINQLRVKRDEASEESNGSSGRNSQKNDKGDHRRHMA